MARQDGSPATARAIASNVAKQMDKLGVKGWDQAVVREIIREQAARIDLDAQIDPMLGTVRFKKSKHRLTR
jgi:hypothetical protein